MTKAQRNEAAKAHARMITRMMWNTEKTLKENADAILLRVAGETERLGGLFRAGEIDAGTHIYNMEVLTALFLGMTGVRG